MSLRRILCTIVLAGWASTIVFSQTALALGGDLSMLPQYESVKTPYYNSKGRKISNVLNYLRDDCGWNAVRVRLFVSPDPAEARSGVVQDLAYVTALGKRVKDSGMSLMLDLHYSDTWADPGNQSVPSSWYTGTLSRSNPSNAALQDSVYNYTRRCLVHMAENGARPDFVQIGNEVSYGMLWRTAADRCYSSSAPSVWLRFTGLLSAAAKAVREATPEAKIVLHTERSGNAEQARSFYQQIDRNGVDYDIIGLSYYPFWHGTLDDLSVTLNTLGQDFPSKPVYIVETAYYYKDFSSVEGIIYDTSSTWPATAEGQQTFILDLCRELASHKNVEGLYYWFPEENGSGGATYNEANVVLRTWQNRGLWDNTTHKLNPGLLTLKEFITAKEAIITPPDPPKPTLGDIDGDGQITVSDITRLIDIYLGLE